MELELVKHAIETKVSRAFFLYLTNYWINTEYDKEFYNRLSNLKAIELYSYYASKEQKEKAKENFDNMLKTMAHQAVEAEESITDMIPDKNYLTYMFFHSNKQSYDKPNYYTLIFLFIRSNYDNDEKIRYESKQQFNELFNTLVDESNSFWFSKNLSGSENFHREIRSFNKSTNYYFIAPKRERRFALEQYHAIPEDVIYIEPKGT